jgi:hypothetical protein
MNDLRSPRDYAFRRPDHRFAVSFPVVFDGVRIIGDATLRNLSRRGCAMQGAGQLRCGTLLMLHLLLDEQHSVIPIDKAIVRWRRGSLVGIEFKWMTEDAQRRLSHFLWRKTMTHFNSTPSAPPAQ